LMKVKLICLSEKIQSKYPNLFVKKISGYTSVKF
jgi:hypothetical protein